MNLRMKRLLSCAAAIFAAAVFAAEPAPVVNWAKPGQWRAIAPAEVSSDGAIVTIQQPGSAFTTIAAYPIDGGQDTQKTYQGISFRVRGDGSDEWGCIGINNGLRFGGVYYFPVKSTDWVEYRVAFSDMAPACDHTPGLPRTIAVGDLGSLSLGDRWKIGTGNLDRPTFRYEVTDLKLLPEIPARFEAKPLRPMPLRDAVAKMKKGEQIRIICFGDSITAGTSLRNRAVERYAALLGPALAKHFNNPGITSHCAATGGAHGYESVAWLDRDLQEGLPDVATMLIGYNNCSSAQSPEMYRKHLSMWVERLTELTQGKCAIVLIPTVPGVPRFTTQDYMAKITREVAKEYGCTVAPIDEAIRRMGPLTYKKQYLADTVHPNAEGHKFFCNILLGLFTR